MKKLTALFLFLMIFSVPSMLFSEQILYTSLGAGTGGASDGNSFSIDVGGFTDDKDTNALVAVGLSVIDADEISSGTSNTQLTGDFTAAGTKQTDNEIAFYMKLGMETMDSFFVFLTGGASYFDESEIVRSNTTGTLHIQTTQSEWEGLFGGGLLYFLNEPNLGFQLEYDNRRGVTGSIAFKF